MSFAALVAHELVRAFGARRVLDGVSLTASPGRRLGLIGENGSGKSTLLRLLAGVDTPDGGSVARPADVGFLHQEMPFDGTSTIADILAEALRDARFDLAELDRLSVALAAAPEDGELLREYGKRLEHAQAHDVWDADRRAVLVLDGLGLGGFAHDRTLASLSGGERGRLALAAMLVRRPTAMLLDEPTNHLDDAAAAFVEEQLRGLPGVVVVASHDRAFLDAVCTDLLDLDPAVGGPTRFGGTYTAYQAFRRAERDRWQRRYSEEQAELAELRRAVATTAHEVAPGRPRRDNEKMGSGHTAGRVQNQISRRVRNTARRLEVLSRRQVAKPPPLLQFQPPGLPSTALGGLLVSLRDVRVPGRLSLDRLDITSSDRLLVTGPNGAGKSTLLAVVAAASRRSGVRVGLLAQDVSTVDLGLTPREIYAKALGEDAVPLASLGLLAQRDLGRPVGDLSVGQRRRLELALLTADPPELLLLDEPTNHLSPQLCDELEDALGGGPGTVVVASHDRWLRSRWAGRELRLMP